MTRSTHISAHFQMHTTKIASNLQFVAKRLGSSAAINLDRLFHPLYLTLPVGVGGTDFLEEFKVYFASFLIEKESVNLC